MYYQEKLTYVALGLLVLAGCGAALSEVQEHCSEANVSARAVAVAGACEARKATECPKATYPELSDCPFMQRCLTELDQIETECRGQ